MKKNKILISVNIPTFNPTKKYLAKVLKSLERQTLKKTKWELILLDNASKEQLSSIWDLSWHPNARHVRENNLGLTAARLRGIRESKGKLVIFVDDDNVLSKNYLLEALKISSEKPFLGAFSGTCLPVLEQPITPTKEKHLGALAIRIVTKDTWHNVPENSQNMPYGAGMVLRKDVAMAYLKRTSKNKMLRNLDRKGDCLACHGDLDMASTSFQLGLGVGLSPKLKLWHLIPPHRLSDSYLIKMKKDASESKYIYEYLTLKRPPPFPATFWTRPGRLLLWIKMNQFERKMMAAEQTGLIEARKKIKTLIQKRKK